MSFKFEVKPACRTCWQRPPRVSARMMNCHLPTKSLELPLGGWECCYPLKVGKGGCYCCLAMAGQARISSSRLLDRLVHNGCKNPDEHISLYGCLLEDLPRSLSLGGFSLAERVITARRVIKEKRVALAFFKMWTKSREIAHDFIVYTSGWVVKETCLPESGWRSGL